MRRIELTTAIAAPRARCFDLARSVELHTRSTAGTGEVAIAGRTTGLLGPGEEVTWRARHFGIRQRLTSRITAYERPRYFRDSMVRGPFARLDHEHHFAEDGRGGTIMRDVFDFAAPLGPLGRLAERAVLTRYLRRFLEARNRVIKAAAESDDWKRSSTAAEPGDASLGWVAPGGGVRDREPARLRRVRRLAIAMVGAIAGLLGGLLLVIIAAGVR